MTLTLQQLWSMVVSPLVTSLVEGYYRLPELQRRYNENIQAMLKRYPKCNPVTYVLSDKPLVESANGKCPMYAKVGVFQNVTTGVITRSCPVITMHPPTFWEIYRDMKEPDVSLCFEGFLVCGILHELDHIASGNFGSGDPRFFQGRDGSDAERLTWGLTCEHAIRLWKDVYGGPLYYANELFYSQWIKWGRDVNSQGWKNFIEEVYRTCPMIR